MELNIKQHTLTLEKGLTTVPSDLVCDDNTLSQADGLVYLDGEYKPLQNPVDAGLNYGAGYVLAYVHLLNSGSTNYLYYQGTSLYYKGNVFTDKNGTTVITNITDVVSIGNTLIIQTSDNGLYYALWKNGAYEPLGNKIPEPKVSFLLRSSIPTYDIDQSAFSSYRISATGSTKGILTDDLSTVIDDVDHQEDYNNLCIGLYEKLKKRINRKRGFNLPFFLRYAVKLYDGSYTLISNPILMFPSVSVNNLFIFTKDISSMQCNTSFCYLMHKLETSYEDWSDIIKGVDVFMSDPVEINDTVDDCTVNLAGTNVYYNGIYNFYKGASYAKFYESELSSTGTQVLQPFNQKTEAEIKAELLSSSSIYYKIFEAGKIANSKYIKSETLIKKYTLENLTTQDRLENEDYYSHCALYPKITETFNRRLNLAQVKRGFYDGFDFFISYNIVAHDTNQSSGNDVPTDLYFPRYEVTIETAEGNQTVISTGGVCQFPFHWFYYPDPRAKKVTIYFYRQSSDGGHIEKFATYDLTEHPGLNGAYWMGALPTVGDMYDGSSYRPKTGTATSYPTVSSTPETLANYVLQSEVDNPFTFFASGYVRVGQGTIIGMAGLTTALSQDAYKISTTIVFTTQGIWALKINDEGQYTSVAPPFSREVCSVPESITMTDNAVFFVSKKGLMCVTGVSESSVVCVSASLLDNIEGRSLVDFLHATYNGSNACRIAYDYKESLLYIYNIGSAEAYIYSISTGTWTHDTALFDDSGTFLTCVTDYPDSLVQTNGYTVYSLISRPNRNKDVNSSSVAKTYKCSLTTRPVKFDGSLILDSIRQLKHLVSPDIKICRTATEFGSVTTPALLLTIYGSNDLSTWTAISSLKGKPYKFFKFHYDFKNLTATSTFAGTSFIVQQRYTEKML